MAKNSRIETKNLLNHQIVGALADAFGTHPVTIERWISANDDRMSSDKAKAVFSNWNLTWQNGKVSSVMFESASI